MSGRAILFCQVWHIDSSSGYKRYIGETSKRAVRFLPRLPLRKRHFSAGEYVKLETVEVQTAFSEGASERTTFSFYVPTDVSEAGEILFELCHGGQILSSARQPLKLHDTKGVSEEWLCMPHNQQDSGASFSGRAGFDEADIAYGELLVRLECGARRRSSKFQTNADWRHCSASVFNLPFIESMLDDMRGDLRVMGTMLAEASKQLATAQSRNSFRLNADYQNVASYIKPSSRKTDEALGGIPVNLHLGIFSVHSIEKDNSPVFGKNRARVESGSSARRASSVRMSKSKSKRYLTTTCGVPAAHFLSFNKGGLLSQVDAWGSLYERILMLASHLVDELTPISDTVDAPAVSAPVVLNALLEGSVTFCSFLKPLNSDKDRGGLVRRSSAIECSEPGCNELHRYADGVCHRHRSQSRSVAGSSTTSAGEILIWKDEKPAFRAIMGATADFNEITELAQRAAKMQWSILFRRVVVASQALAVIACSFVAELERAQHECDAVWLRRIFTVGWLVNWTSLVSTSGKEMGMLEDTAEAVSILSKCALRLSPVPDGQHHSFEGASRIQVEWMNERSETDISVVLRVRIEQADFDILRGIHSFSRYG